MAVESRALEDTTDEVVVVAFQNGDEGAFAQIVQTYHDVLLARARRQMRSDDDAQDAVQETLLRAYRYLPNFGGQYHLAAWLNRILSNVIADAKRKYGVEVRLRAQLAGVRNTERVPEELVDDATDTPAVRAAVANAVASLSTAHRQAFILRELDDQSYAEMAEILEISEANARARVHRARRILQRSLGSATTGLSAVLIPVHVRLGRIFGRHVTAVSTAKRPINGSVLSSGPGLTVTQSVTQTLGSSTGQALTVAVSEAGRSIVPSSGMVASFIATAAVAVVTPASVLLSPMVSTPAPAAAASQTASPPPGAQVAAVSVPVPPESTTTSTTTAPAASTTTTTAPSASTTTNSASTVPADGVPTWNWITPTATAKAPTTAASTDAPVASTATSSSGSTSSTSPASPTTTPVAVTACPYLQSFPDATSTDITLPPAELATSEASSSLSTETESVTDVSPSFESAGLGTFTSGTQSATTKVVFGACTAATSSPALVANVINPAATGQGELQLRGALVSTSVSGGETDSFFRGSASWLSGPDEGDAPIVFVADVITNVPADTATLDVAFFGTLTDMADPPVPSTCVSSASGTASGTPSSSANDTTSTTQPTDTETSTTLGTEPETTPPCGGATGDVSTEEQPTS